MAYQGKVGTLKWSLHDFNGLSRARCSMILVSDGFDAYASGPVPPEVQGTLIKYISHGFVDSATTYSLALYDRLGADLLPSAASSIPINAVEEEAIVLKDAATVDYYYPVHLLGQHFIQAHKNSVPAAVEITVDIWYSRQLIRKL